MRRTPRCSIRDTVSDRVVQRAQLLVLLASDDLVRADDLFAGQHVVFRDRTRSGALPRDAARVAARSGTIVGWKNVASRRMYSESPTADARIRMDQPCARLTSIVNVAMLSDRQPAILAARRGRRSSPRTESSAPALATPAAQPPIEARD